MLTMTISRFSVLSTLDQEGRSQVYLAEDTSNGRKVAVKVMAGRLSSDPKARRRFDREAQNAAALTGYGFVKIYETGIHEGRPFVAMEYVEGKTLTSLLGTSGPLKFADLTHLAITLGEALLFAHAKGIHGLGLDTGNIMVTPEGDFRILELGVTDADAHRRTMPETEPPEVIERWSPEMTQGDPGGAPSDFWRLGLVLYECATGRRAFEATNSVELVRRIREQPPKKPTALRAGTPVALESIILRCLEKEPAQRYPTPETFVAALNAVPGARRVSVAGLSEVAAVSSAPVSSAPVASAPTASAPAASAPAASRPTMPTAPPAPQPPAPQPPAPQPPAPQVAAPQAARPAAPASPVAAHVAAAPSPPAAPTGADAHGTDARGTGASRTAPPWRILVPLGLLVVAAVLYVVLSR